LAESYRLFSGREAADERLNRVAGVAALIERFSTLLHGTATLLRLAFSTAAVGLCLAALLARAVLPDTSRACIG
jgi:hypothetical protein